MRATLTYQVGTELRSVSVDVEGFSPRPDGTRQGVVMERVPINASALQRVLHDSKQLREPAQLALTVSHFHSPVEVKA